MDGGKSDGRKVDGFGPPSLFPPSIRFSSINLLTHQLFLHQLRRTTKNPPLFWPPSDFLPSNEEKVYCQNGIGKSTL